MSIPKETGHDLAMRKSPLGTLFPKIGIRPTIDGRRRGVRESLEAQTMEMARSAAALISSRLRYPDGSPVQCVIADTTIGGVAESSACTRKFHDEHVGVSLTVTRSWCYGAETMDMTPHLPKGVWGFNGTERPGAVYLAAVLAAYSQKGMPAFGIYGRDVQDIDDSSIPPDVEEQLLRFARAGLAVAMMRGRAYLSVGGVSMGIAGSIIDHGFLENYLGMRVETIDSTELLRRMDQAIFSADEYDRAASWVRRFCAEGRDENVATMTRCRSSLDREWETSIKMALIMKDLMAGNRELEKMGFGEEAQGHDALLAGFQGQRQWTDYQPNGDFMEAVLNTSFDWDGPRAPYLVATENDHLNGVSMLFNYLLTNTAQIFADVRTYWSPEAVARVTGHSLEGRAASGILHLINSGPAALDGTGGATQDGLPVIKPFWDLNQEDIDECLKATTWHPSITEYFPGGGWSTHYRTKGGLPVTMCRINLVKGLGPALQIAEGFTVELPDSVHVSLDERTNSTWPTTWFVPNLTDSPAFRDVYSVMRHWGANHGAISYGHIGADLISLAAMLRIPVYMHNVPEERIFRPSTWAAFGTADLEAADFRACESFGPVYR